MERRKGVKETYSERLDTISEQDPALPYHIIHSQSKANQSALTPPPKNKGDRRNDRRRSDGLSLSSFLLMSFRLLVRMIFPFFETIRRRLFFFVVEEGIVES